MRKDILLHNSGQSNFDAKYCNHCHCCFLCHNFAISVVVVVVVDVVVDVVVAP